MEIVSSTDGSMPAELDELTRRVMRLEIEEAALAKESDAASQGRRETLTKELARPACQVTWSGARTAGAGTGCRPRRLAPRAEATATGRCPG